MTDGRPNSFCDRMRIIAGTYGGRRLKTLKGEALRPTSDQLRETLFSVLGESIRSATFLDMYAGSGAVGIEALSRGAREVVFVEHHRPAVDLIRENHHTLRELGRLKILRHTSLVIAEHSRHCQLEERYGVLSRARLLRHGDSQLAFYQAL